jgi:hypothetical protein
MGLPMMRKKDAFLTELAMFFSKNKEPYAVGRDFNIIRYASEKTRVM